MTKDRSITIFTSEDECLCKNFLYTLPYRENHIKSSTARMGLRKVKVQFGEAANHQTTGTAQLVNSVLRVTASTLDCRH